RNPGEQFNPDRTVGEMLREVVRVASISGEDPIDKDWSDYFYRVGIVEPERLLPKVLGELPDLTLRRLGLMRALMTHSKMIVLDHVVCALDRIAAEQFYELIRQLRDETGMAVLLFTGTLQGVEKFADRAAVLFDGGMLEIGDSESVIERPTFSYSRELLACSPRLTRGAGQLPLISREAIEEAEAQVHRAQSIGLLPRQESEEA
ncbi:MAG: hypothetical protein AAGA96_20370, partial [Verrucomicrobiota bacterium]